MKRIFLTVWILLMAAAPMTALADDTSPFTWEAGVVSDYVFRGASQTDEDPTVQAGLTWTHDSGFYAGAWASGVDFGTDKPDAEVDVFVGYSFDINEAVNLDVALNRYNYPDAGASNYNELITTTTFAEQYTLTVAYSDDFGGSDTDAWYVAAGTSLGLPEDFSLDLSVGRSLFEKEFSEDYTDWSIGVSRSWGLLSASLAYVGTDGNGRDIYGKLADSRVVLTLSVGQ